MDRSDIATNTAPATLPASDHLPLTTQHSTLVSRHAAPSVDVFPALVFKEFLAALLISVLLMVWSLASTAPLLSEANPGKTENPATAPW